MCVPAACPISCGTCQPFRLPVIDGISRRCRVAPRCPRCQQPVVRDKIVNDKILQRELQSLEVFCAQKDKGCHWEGTLKDYQVESYMALKHSRMKSSTLLFQAHIESCDHLTTECPNGCGIRFEKRFMDKHQSEDCSKRTVVCEFCKCFASIGKSHCSCLRTDFVGKTNIVFEDEIPHLTACSEFKIPCPNKCSTVEYTRGQVTRLRHTADEHRCA